MPRSGSSGMVARPVRALVGLVLCLAAGTSRAAEPAADAWFDPKQLPTFTGTIDRILIDAAGHTDGVLLKEGPQIILTAELGRRLHDAFKAGDSLTVYGVRARQAAVISALAVQLPGAGGGVVLHPGLAPRHAGPAHPSAGTPLTVEGKIRTVLRDMAGQPTGALLEDGTILRLGDLALPDGVLSEGNVVAVDGTGYDGADGRAILARRLALVKP